VFCQTSAFTLSARDSEGLGDQGMIKPHGKSGQLHRWRAGLPSNSSSKIEGNDC